MAVGVSSVVLLTGSEDLGADIDERSDEEEESVEHEEELVETASTSPSNGGALELVGVSDGGEAKERAGEHGDDSSGVHARRRP
jgi:hypothetical protein